VVVFVAGLFFTLTRRQDGAIRTATPFILGTLALGQLGQGLGQRLVRDAIDKVPALDKKVDFLNLGTGEAAACLVVSGGAALALCIVALGVSLADRGSNASR